jgi:hypothetical protein
MAARYERPRQTPDIADVRLPADKLTAFSGDRWDAKSDGQQLPFLPSYRHGHLISPAPGKGLTRDA